MDYEIDVFISYRRKGPVKDWLKHHFYPMLCDWLPEYLPHEPKIFIDWGIETGSDWSSVLSKNIKHSRCLLSIWSTEYFRSSWCLAELHSMMEREKVELYRTNENPNGLIYPIKFTSDEHFPAELKEKFQWKDLSKLNSQFKSFRKTKGIVDLENEVKVICGELEKMIKRCPKWRDWPVITPDTPEFSRCNFPGMQR